MPETGYVAYIDEAGDFGLKTVAPIDPRGASEWFVMGAVLVRKENEKLVPGWLKAIRMGAKNNQPLDLHFRTLTPRQKSAICRDVAKLPMRLFVVISNKRNMRRYVNPAAAHISQHKHWFYWWMARLLLERVTDFCAAQNEKTRLAPRALQLEFSRRKDLRRHEFTDYFTRLWVQRQTAYLNKRTINWDIFDFGNVHFFDHETRAGLQFADVLASSFFQAVNIHPQGSCCPDYALALSPLVCRHKTGGALDHGFTVWPTSLKDVPLLDGQKLIFRHYGYPERQLPR